jgi:glycosyltransferase involved in cell wall biosynthesis
VDVLLQALTRASRPWRLVVASASDHAALQASALRIGVAGRLVFAPLATEDDRVYAHAAADVAVVPRRAPGGLPIKLLDTLARGLPAVANRRALAGLSLGPAVTVVADDDPEAFARGVEAALGDRTLRVGAPSDQAQRALAEAGLTPAAFVARFERACGLLPTGRAWSGR